VILINATHNIKHGKAKTWRWMENRLFIRKNKINIRIS
jgi:hypothetical protein